MAGRWLLDSLSCNLISSLRDRFFPWLLTGFRDSAHPPAILLIDLMIILINTKREEL